MYLIWLFFYTYIYFIKVIFIYLYFIKYLIFLFEKKILKICNNVR